MQADLERKIQFKTTFEGNATTDENRESEDQISGFGHHVGQKLAPIGERGYKEVIVPVHEAGRVLKADVETDRKSGGV